MRAAKQGDSPSGYDREVRPRRLLDRLARHEREVRRRNDERWWTRVDAVLSCRLDDAVEDVDFPGCVW